MLMYQSACYIMTSSVSAVNVVRRAAAHPDAMCYDDVTCRVAVAGRQS